MALIDWGPGLSVGVKEIDEQHKKWIAITNELNDAMKTGKTAQVLGDILKKMADYISVHFAAEEALMHKAVYGEFAAHKKIHDAYITMVNTMMADFKAGKILMSIQIMSSLKDWLTNHIQGQDKKYTPALNKHGIV